MKNVFWRRSLCSILCAGFLLGAMPGQQAEAAVGTVSSWAEAAIAQAEEAGLIPQVFDGQDMAQPVSRQEFCTVALMMYERMTGVPAPRAMNSNFTDTMDSDVNRACELGLVSGRGNGMFMPDDGMTREEMFGLLYNLLRITNQLAELEEAEARALLESFNDVGEVADWAVMPMGMMLKLELTSGANPGLMEPKGTPTREQAIALALRFTTELTVMPTPMAQASEEAPEIAIAPEISTNTADGDHLISVSRGETLPQVLNELATDSEDYRDKLKRVYGDNVARYSATLPHYPNETAAEADMVTITIPAWDLVGGNYVAKTYDIIVQRNLTATYQAIFDEIYQLPNKFPIHDIGCYAWRNGTSGHSSGTAIDINANENPQMRNNGTIIVGVAYEPNSNPYSITEDGDVVRIFAKYGFAWGGNAWRSSKDYMHFSYFGI